MVVLSGRDKGKNGEVLEWSPKRRSRVIVSGRQHGQAPTAPSADQPAGGIVEKEAPIHVSNVAHVDPEDGKPTRVGFTMLEDGRKVRFAKRSGEVIDR